MADFDLADDGLIHFHPYVRYSTPDQGNGDSILRQMADREQYARQHGGLLDFSLGLSDLGVSAYRGKNRLCGALGRFLAAIREGRLGERDVLLIESFDRLSREHISEAWEVWRAILKAGVRIAVGPPWVMYDQDTLNDPIGCFLPLMEFYRSWSESKRKSDLAKAVFDRKYKDYLQTGRRFTGRCPLWLRPAGDGFEEIPERVAPLRAAGKQLREGMSFHEVATWLNERYEPFGHRTWQSRNRAPRWYSILLRRWFRGREVLGELRRADGTILTGYYPAIIDEATWEAIQVAIETRRGKVGRPCSGLPNLFSGLLWDARTRSRLKRWSANAGRYCYLSTHEPRMVCEYQRLEREILYLLLAINPLDFSHRSYLTLRLHARLKKESENLRRIEQSSQVLRVQIQAPDSDDAVKEALQTCLAGIELRHAETARDLTSLRFKARSATPETLASVHEMILAYLKADEASKRLLFRRLRQEIALFVSEIWVLRRRVAPRLSWVDVRVYCHNGLVTWTGFYNGLGTPPIDFPLKDLGTCDLREWAGSAP
jgi:DNA invertase Pin-like site-specific DNA recombinase